MAGIHKISFALHLSSASICYLANTNGGRLWRQRKEERLVKL